ncbi:MAG: phBC6A51 family helix-turn-helix protein [Eubacterium sp.]
MDKLSKLEQLLKETNIKQEFNIVEDLKGLAMVYGVIKSKDFRKKLDALIEKYETNELTSIRETLIEKCRKGDVQAIRLYIEYFKPITVTEADDGLLEALAGAGKEAFADEV